MGSLDQGFISTTPDCQKNGRGALNADADNLRRQFPSNEDTNDGSANFKTGEAKLVQQPHLPLVELTGLSADTAALGALTTKANDAMRKFFFADAPKLPKFYANFPHPQDNTHLSAAWDIGQVLEATLSTNKLTGNQSKAHELDQDFKVLGHYWDQQSRPPGYDSSYGPGGDKYYDDNSWIGIAMLDAYKQNSDSSELKTAKQIFRLEQSGTQGTDKLSHPGGVLWTQQHDNLYRASVSTAGAAQLSLELYQQTHDKQYLQFASKEFDWVNNNLRAPNGLYYDGMDKDGSIHKEEYSYNQGLMLGDASLLYKATGDHKYLEQAQEIAKSSLQNFSGDENQAPFAKQLLFFNSVFFKNLILLDSVAPDPAYRQALADYSAQVTKKIDTQTGLVNVDGKNTLLDQASAVQILALARDNPPK